MDNSGKNRYELLFMDDDVSDPLDNIKKKVKQPAAATGAAVVPSTAVTTLNKGQNNNTNKQNASAGNDSSKKNSSEKENKSFAMNKNVDFNRKSNTAGNNAINNASVGGGGGGVSKSKPNQQQLGNNSQNANRNNRDNFNGPASQNRNSTSKAQNGETREQRNNRRNRENGIPGSMGGSGGGGSGGMGEYNNDSQQRIRQNNQRFNGPPRNRNGADGGNARGGKREFDRQSGSDKTGVKAVDKRDGAGAHNWGSVKQDIEDINKSNDEAGLTDKEESGNDQTATEQNASIEEETKELTLDEWKAQRQQRAKPQFNIRKAGEGEDVTQWKKMIALNNKKKEGDSEEELEYDPSMYPQRVGRLQRVLDIQFHFNDGRRGGGGMGRGRGRGSRPTGGAERPIGGERGNTGGNVGGVGAAISAQGGGGRPDGPRVNVGRPRNENPRREGGGMDKQQRGGQHAPKVDDERQFPTLS
ncbi:plasminogen activator inhibitor 1 RNA-binding protein-like isoform X2 [Eupeodes corollae]|uniref:plasminogen activator inhibitor 1 RNA-binding protein-like isoform X2 n=1 Tax=Eupeodes corollae TaxID=290404 RepID=UPI002490765E|nr:plasminogen activator inhibitor 1 RNA-binding protein-like isoform X2 [Eupeodes corollae]